MDRLRLAQDPGGSAKHVVWLLVGVAGLSASITSLFLAMRAVLDVGGFCAEGGPFVIATPCPEGVSVLMPLGTLGWFVFAGTIAWAGGRVGGLDGLAFLAWPALFLALGWNFLESGFAPPGGGIEVGFAMPGVLFWLMGGGPLLVVVWDAWQGRGRRERWDRLAAAAVARSTAAGASSAAPPEGARASGASGPGASGPVGVARSTISGSAASIRAARAAVAGAFGTAITTRSSAPAPGSEARAVLSADPDAANQPDAANRPASLADELERLADLRRRGDLSMLEYDAAKRAVIREHEARR